MKINLGNFGNVGLEVPQQSARGAPAGAFGTGEALSDAGRVVGGVADRMLAEQQAEQRAAERERDAEAKAAAREADRVKSITAQAEAKNALADLHDGIGRGLLDGSVDKAKAGEDFTAQSQKIISKSLAGVSPEHQQLVKASLIDDVGRYQRGVTSLVDQKNRADIGAGMASYIEQMQRYAQRGEGERQEAIANIEAFVSSAGPASGMDAAKTAATIQGFKEGVTFQYLDNAVTKAQRDGKALGSLAASLDKYPELDPAKRNFLEAKIQRNQQHLATMGEVAERRRLSNLNTMATRLSRYVENGMDIPSAEFDAFEKGSKGTPFEGFTAQIAAEQKAVSELAGLPPTAMIAKVKELEASYGKTPTLEQAAHLNKVGKFVQNSIKMLNAEPLEYAEQRRGAVVEPLDLGNVGSWASNLANRSDILIEQNKSTGAPPKGLKKDEAAALSSFLMTAAPEAQRDVLKALSKGFGNMEVFRATVQQIAPDNPVVASAGLLAARNAVDSKGRNVADIILQGNSMLRGDTKTDGKPTGGKVMPMPDESEMRVKFADTVKNAYAGKDNAQSIDFQTARAAYAKLASDAGDHSGKINFTRWNDAVEIAVGQVGKWNGSHVVLPHGMDKGQFKDALRAKTAEIVRSGNVDTDVTMSRLWDAPMENAGSGQYFFRVGDGYLVGKDGRKIVVDLNK